MGIAGSPDIFQSKMSELMESLEYVQAYLDDLLCNLGVAVITILKNLKRYSGPFAMWASKATLKY
jgi:hypothetical protein